MSKTSIFLLTLAVVIVIAAGTFLKRDTLFADKGPIDVGHLSYHSGDFATFGPQFDGAVDFTVALINENPPLNRELISIHQDIGTIGEEAASKTLLMDSEVEVLLNVAHNYTTYQDWMRGYVATNNAPLMPSVHGGAIASDIGGNEEEPLFRGSPMDTGQSAAAVYQASEAGFESIVIVGTTLDGMKSQMRSARNVAAELEIEVLGQINMPAGKTEYDNVISELNRLEPDAVIVFSVPEDGGQLVKATADAGLSLNFIGTSEWTSGDFPAIATMDAINQHQNVWTVAFTNANTRAWSTYKDLWESSEYASLSDAGNSYTMQYYDLLNVTALAIESAGSTDATDWADHMKVVSNGPGEKVYSYAEGVAALRAGKSIDYSGVTGDMDYTSTGVVSGLYGVFAWTSLDSLDRIDSLDDRTVLALDR